MSKWSIFTPLEVCGPGRNMTSNVCMTGGHRQGRMRSRTGFARICRKDSVGRVVVGLEGSFVRNLPLGCFHRCSVRISVHPAAAATVTCVVSLGMQGLGPHCRMTESGFVLIPRRVVLMPKSRSNCSDLALTSERA